MLTVLTKRLAISPSIAALLSVCVSLINKHLTNTMDLTIQPESLSLGERDRDTQREEGGKKQVERGTMGQPFSQWA